MAQATPISDSEWDVMEPIWEAVKRLCATHDWNPQHDPDAVGAARRKRSS